MIAAKRLVAVTGGIGSGKSVVCRALMAMGYEVYDCDARAKRLMDQSQEIKHELIHKIHPASVDAQGVIDRGKISEVVFSDPEKLSVLNEIVHRHVREDLLRWREAHASSSLLFVETAILYQSGLDAMVDEVWEVTAPEALRIRRVMSRNAVTAQQVESRMRSQSYAPVHPHPLTRAIINDDHQSVLLQLHQLLSLT